MTREKTRKIESALALALSTLAALLGIFWLVFILGDVVRKGAAAITPALFLHNPTPEGISGGGLKNAFVGQALITVFATVAGVPLGLLGGTFLAEYGRGKITHLISALSDIMISVPTMVVGTFIYAVMVKPLGHFNGWAGSAALAVIMVPVVVRTTESMLRLVPWTLREAAFALGAPKYKVITQVVYRGAITGIFTGVLLSIARVAGETAPLLFTSFNNNFFSADMKGPIASLTVTIYQYAMGPYDDLHAQAWAAALVITLFILLITIIGRAFIKLRFGKRGTPII